MLEPRNNSLIFAIVHLSLNSVEFFIMHALIVHIHFMLNILVLY